VLADVLQVFRQQAWKDLVVRLLVHLYRHPVRQVALHFVAVAHDFARVAFQRLQALAYSVAPDHVHDARGLGLVAATVD
jgi:hypothetical protein